ncbi:MAG: polyhydroxyalkanoic acid system family protein [Thermoguttaceae bacterium]|jgi:hypothetical protein
MSSLTKTFKHSLGKEEAARRIRERISAEKIDKAMVATVNREVWNDPYNLDFAMTVFKYRIDGALNIGDDMLTLKLNLPMGANIFKGMIEDLIQKQMDAMMS